MIDTDFRSDQLRTLCTVIENSITELKDNYLALNNFYAEMEMDKSEDVKEYIESFYGALLVTCQAYAVGTVSDINSYLISIGEKKFDKWELYKQNTPALDYSHIELINELANYFKHHDEWDSWPENKKTVKVLKYYKITEDSEFPLAQGIYHLIGEGSLRELCAILELWRDWQIRIYVHKQFVNN